MYAIIGGVLASSCRPMTDGYEAYSDWGGRVMHVIHPNDIKPLRRGDIEYLRQYRKGIQASVLIVVQLDEGRRFCSGFIHEIRGSEIEVISNHHCFSLYEDVAASSSYDLLEDACARTKVIFNATEGFEENLASAQCIEGTLETDYRVDIASFRAVSDDGELPENIESLSIALSDETDFSAQAYIIHHPLDVAFVRYKNTALPGATITESDCQIIGEYVSREEWQSSPVLAMSFKHTCDLSKGSSGSALISKDTHEVIGLNWGGVKTLKKEGGSNKELDISNAAIKPSCIHDYLYDRANLENCVSDPLFARSFSDSSAQQTSTSSNQDGVEVVGWLSGCSGQAQAFQKTGLRQSSHPLIPLLWMLGPFFVYGICRLRISSSKAAANPTSIDERICS